MLSMMLVADHHLALKCQIKLHKQKSTHIGHWLNLKAGKICVFCNISSTDADEDCRNRWLRAIFIKRYREYIYLQASKICTLQESRADLIW